MQRAILRSPTLAAGADAEAAFTTAGGHAWTAPADMAVRIVVAVLAGVSFAREIEAREAEEGRSLLTLERSGQSLGDPRAELGVLRVAAIAGHRMMSPG